MRSRWWSFGEDRFDRVSKHAYWRGAGSLRRQLDELWRGSYGIADVDVEFELHHGRGDATVHGGAHAGVVGVVADGLNGDGVDEVVHAVVAGEEDLRNLSHPAGDARLVMSEVSGEEVGVSGRAARVEKRRGAGRP